MSAICKFDDKLRYRLQSYKSYKNYQVSLGLLTPNSVATGYSGSFVRSGDFYNVWKISGSRLKVTNFLLFKFKFKINFFVNELSPEVCTDIELSVWNLFIVIFHGALAHINEKCQLIRNYHVYRV